MKLKKPKTCKGCVAWMDKLSGKCDLGFRQKDGGERYDTSPDGPCLKPLSFNEFCNARDAVKIIKSTEK